MHLFILLLIAFIAYSIKECFQSTSQVSRKEYIIIAVISLIITLLSGSNFTAKSIFYTGAAITGHIDNSFRPWNLDSTRIYLIPLDENLKRKGNYILTDYNTYNGENNYYYAEPYEHGKFRIYGIEPGKYAFICISSDIRATSKREREAHDKLKEMNSTLLSSSYDTEIEVIDFKRSDKIVRNVKFIEKKYASE